MPQPYRLELTIHGIIFTVMAESLILVLGCCKWPKVFFLEIRHVEYQVKLKDKKVEHNADIAPACDNFLLSADKLCKSRSGPAFC